MKLSFVEQSNEHEDVPDWCKVFELWFEEVVLISFDCDDIKIFEELCLLMLSWREQSIELECNRDWWSSVDNDGEDDILCWLGVNNSLSEDDISMLKLSCLEQ